MLKTLARKSSYIGDKIGSLAILYSALFLPGQGFMFGMIYGAFLYKKAGVSMKTHVEQIPLTIKVVDDYYDVFASSVRIRITQIHKHQLIRTSLPLRAHWNHLKKMELIQNYPN